MITICLFYTGRIVIIFVTKAQQIFFRRIFLKLKMTRTPNIAIFASGAGTNAEKVIQFYNTQTAYKANIKLVVCNKAGAGVLDVAAAAKIEILLIDRDIFFNGDHYLPVLQALQIDWIILAGFLWKIPPGIVKVFQNRMINIHPALLPRHGGKGMYGHHVHEAVIAAGDRESGITIHYVDEKYDNGTLIAQYKCAVAEEDTAASLNKKIQFLEHSYFAETIAKEIAKG